jgi:hypothetical protein
METVTVKQIHNEFDTASDALYQEAVRNTAINFNRIEKSRRLEKLGFTKSSERVKKPEKEALPVYYRKKYPFLKFITRECLEAICEKYGLIYAEVFHYTGEIPEKNLWEIENAQPIDKEDEFDAHSVFVDIESRMTDMQIQIVDNERIQRILYALGLTNEVLVRGYSQGITRSEIYNRRISEYARTLFIAANKELFDLENMKNVKGTHGYAPKDPIVFRWVKGGVLIISKWGDEANDPELVVPELN